MQYEIYYPTKLSEISDVQNDNVDVCVVTEDGKHYTFVIITPNNLMELMKKSQMEFITAAHPFLIVEELNEKIIEKAIEDLMGENEEIIRVYGCEY